MADSRGRAGRLQDDPGTFIVPESKKMLKEEWRHVEKTKYPKWKRLSLLGQLWDQLWDNVSIKIKLKIDHCALNGMTMHASTLKEINE